MILNQIPHFSPKQKNIIIIIIITLCLRPIIKNKTSLYVVSLYINISRVLMRPHMYTAAGLWNNKHKRLQHKHKDTQLMKAAVKPARRSAGISSVHSLCPITTHRLRRRNRKQKLYLSSNRRMLWSAGDEGEDEDVKVALGGVISKLSVFF